MTKFENGPAHGKTLMLRRAPVYLRVVVNAKGEIDALDQLDDTPHHDEAIHAYKVHGEVSGMHLNCRGKKSGGFYTMATYRYIEDQPDDETMLNGAKWAAWCEKMGR